jgi:HK97 gp10 family phage protein
VKTDHGRSDPDELREIANSDEVQHEALQAARAIRSDARRLAPSRTGNLRRHIEVEKILDTRTGVQGYAIGWDDAAWYGQMVEQGTEHTRAQPHLVPAAIKNGATGAGTDA